MIREKLHIFIALVATLVMTIICIVMQTPLMRALVQLVLTLITFYILGLVAQYLINISLPPKAIEIPEEYAEESETETETDDADDADAAPVAADSNN